MVDKKRAACFAGHRSIPYKDINKIRRSLDIAIEELYQKGVIYFGVGGTTGFNVMAEEAVIRARKKHHEIKLIIILPCKDHDKYWSKETKKRFLNILSKADKVICLSDKYYRGCMQNCNRYLVDFSGYCMAYLADDGDEILYTVDYAYERGLEFTNITTYFERPSVIFYDKLNKLLCFALLRRYPI